MVQASQPDTDSSTPHTPIPWMRNGQTMNGWWRIDGSSERMGLNFLARPTAIVPDDVDADFIERAVNNHAKLLAALKRLLLATKAASRGCPACGCGPHEGGRRHYEPCSVTIAEAAIEEAQS